MTPSRKLDIRRFLRSKSCVDSNCEIDTDGVSDAIVRKEMVER